MGLTIGLMYNLGKYNPTKPGEPPDANAEFDSERTVLAVANALSGAGHEVVWIEGNEEAYETLRMLRPELVFNMCEGLRGESRESHIPAMLEMLGIPYTGSGILALAQSLDKAAAKKLFHFHGLTTPAFRTLFPGAPIEPQGLRFPLFVKPVSEGSSKGITPSAVVRNPAELVERVSYLHQLYRQPVLVEEYLDGREFTVGIVGNAEPVIFPVLEINYALVPPEHGRVYTYQFKQEWDADEYYLCPAPIDPVLELALKEAALAAMRALGCVDVARVDLRLDADGRPSVLEVNALPGLSPGFSDLCRQAEKAGWTYPQLVNGIVAAALARYGLPNPTQRIAESA